MPTPAKNGTHEYTYPCCKSQSAYLHIKPEDERIEAERQCMGCKRKYVMVMRIDKDKQHIVNFEKWRDLQPKKVKK